MRLRLQAVLLLLVEVHEGNHVRQVEGWIGKGDRLETPLVGGLGHSAAVGALARRHTQPTDLRPATLSAAPACGRDASGVEEGDVSRTVARTSLPIKFLDPPAIVGLRVPELGEHARAVRATARLGRSPASP